MAMNFWEAQRRARSRTKVFLTAFIVLTLGIAVGAEALMREAAGPDYSEGGVPVVALLFLAITFGTALYQYTAYATVGGSYVAESIGARRVSPDTADFKERQLLNTVEEIALACALPVPAVYIMEAKQINAFAAGLTQDKAAIAVTRGTLELLDRDELQGVIAHEFGHIYNGDMRISMQLAAMLMGFFIVLYLGFRLLRTSMLFGGSSRREGKGGNPMMAGVIILMAAGATTWFFGSILRAMVSREREYLADACAVQFTRNPSGIANALRKIGSMHVHDMPKEGAAFAHMYFDHQSLLGSIFATHPPLKKRIEAIEGRTYMPEEWKEGL
jgi:heat shock protein HtpX